MANIGKTFMEVLIGMIFIQIVAVVIGGLSNFSALGLIIAGFVDVILMALLIMGVSNKF